MEFDLKSIPFSRSGSYMVVSEHEAAFQGGNNPAGLYLRTIHRSSSTPFIAKVIPTKSGEAVEFQYTFSPAELVLCIDDNKIRICFADDGTLLMKGTGKDIGLTLDFMTSQAHFDYIYEIPKENGMWYMANCFKNNRQYLLHAQEGGVTLDQDWRESTADHCRIAFQGKDQGFFLSLTEIATEWDGRIADFDFEESLQKTKGDFCRFSSTMPSVPEKYKDAGEMAAYVLWSCAVRKEGLLPRDAIFMSKNWMCSVWSWDHCFNAIALSYRNPEMAWDQFMLLFDLQDSFGRIPDSVNDSHVTWNYCKPPIHGWALSKMMRNMELTRTQAFEAYDRLSKWTGWWLNYRDHDRDGVCEYTHGNDSGWDNATVFFQLPPVETPELQAFLILQMEVLAELAERLGRNKDAQEWKEKSAEMMAAMIAHCFRNGYPCGMRSATHEPIECSSLLLFVPIVLGKKLPADILRTMLGVLKSDAYLTEYGYATESPSSQYYRPDGYWRGPIWAPSTMLLLDGLSQCGEKETVRKVAEKFCAMVSRSGFAENFDALTGEGLRDKAYTWTSSVFLTMAHEYLS